MNTTLAELTHAYQVIYTTIGPEAHKHRLDAIVAILAAITRIADQAGRQEAQGEVDREWIPWRGGKKSPIDNNLTVEIKCRGGQQETGSAGAFIWRHDGDPCDIIAFRLASQK